MLNLPTITDLENAIATVDDPTLKQLLADRLADTVKRGLQDLTHVLVIEAGDTEQQIIDAIGFSPLRSRIDDTPNTPDWDWLERHTGWWELIYTIGNDGFAFIVLVQDDDRAPLAPLYRGREGEARP